MEMLGRAYSILDVKAVDSAARTLSGIATTSALDRVGDVINPLGVRFENPLPFLWQHDSSAPIGLATFDAPTEAESASPQRFPPSPNPPALIERLAEAWESMTTGLVRAVSIGFRALEYAFTETEIRYDSIEVFELSAVTISANSEALISSVKSADAALRARAGISRSHNSCTAPDSRRARPPANRGLCGLDSPAAMRRNRL